MKTGMRLIIGIRYEKRNTDINKHSNRLQAKVLLSEMDQSDGFVTRMRLDRYLLQSNGN